MDFNKQHPNAQKYLKSAQYAVRLAGRNCMVFGKAATQTQYNFMNHSINTSMPRRDFLKRTAVLTAGLATLGGIMPLRAAKGPNEKVVVAIIG
ncbi:MAG: twin-arginine translocation signal domain-containing protein, partial [Verrucomicrobiota bacterium]